ncbi:DUF2653 family protein [Paenibacillus psychroresistens]|uniref:DUF2653 family protein n=1 Tax=Paenibacillus psychroresistens TaxID=1778678 RepID=A0A6B8RLM3_9BACL|nr:DUF2653 family protein [Paenibacillus psychroresistens]QGQ96747.1 DUF2653 family protein [Paenibacillus psychroresistens]
MRLSEQDIMNAICMHVGERKQIKPEFVKVQLMWDEDLGFSAEVLAEGRSQILIEASILEAIERYLLVLWDHRVFRSQITLDIDEEMFANIDEQN